MNRQPISLAHDLDLRLSEDAMRRAAKRARIVARQTGTQLVYCYHGEVLHISPDEQDAVEAAWAGEVERRIQAYEAGGATVFFCQGTAR
ncbi:MAG: hypothetical protein FD134_785 [Gallionellaceae bacterium]|nr:MAG: hypothetical protein FD134_785 [Gallionellaceae bacterium]